MDIVNNKITSPSEIELKSRDDKKFTRLVNKYKTNNPKFKLKTLGGGVYTCTDKEFIIQALNSELIIVTGKMSGKQANVLKYIEDLEQIVGDFDIKSGDPAYYYVHINYNNAEKVLCFESADEVLSMRKWRSRLFDTCGIVLGIRGKEALEEFDDFVAQLYAKGKVIWKDVESEDGMAGSIMLGEINKLVATESRDAFLADEDMMLLEDDMRIVRSSTIRTILLHNYPTISLTKIREVLRPDLAQNTGRVMVGGRRVSVWYFKN